MGTGSKGVQVKHEGSQLKTSRTVRPNVVVVGSLHMDLTVKARKLPRLGETVLGDEFKMSTGGKGANQAVAAAKLGASVTLIGRVGTDKFGRDLIRNAERHAIDTSFIVKDNRVWTGLALIMVDEKGNNMIAVAPGADTKCSKGDIDRADSAIRAADVLLTQLETPLPVVEYAIQRACAHGVRVILNPSPAQTLPASLLERTYALIPNEREAERISGVSVKNLFSAKRAIEKILEKGVKNIILTMGKQGALIGTKEKIEHVASPKVNTVDTTGAGDAFSGALAVAISAGKSLEKAVAFANCAGALATTKIGAQEAMPTRHELENFMKEKGLT